MSRFNTLLLGAPLAVADEELSNGPATADDLRLALINALRRIDALERKLSEHTRPEYQFNEPR